MKDLLRKIIPLKYRRMYRKYFSPIIRDLHYFELKHRRDFFERALCALSFNGIDGDYLEFGCCGGRTFGLAYKISRKYKYFCKMWAFDSFCGLPPQSVPEDNHPAWIEGTMSIGVDEFEKICKENKIPKKDYAIVPGFYEDSLNNVSELPSNISLAYIDCDLYSSTKSVLEFLMPRLKHGMIIAFDDYFCYSATQVSGERKACAEFFLNHPKWDLVPFMSYGGGGGGMSFVVEDKDLCGHAGSTF